MTLSFHALCVPPLAHALKSLASILEKGLEDLQSRELDESYLLEARLYPNMFPLRRHVQIATDMARRGALRICGAEVTSVADSESSFSQLIERSRNAREEILGLEASRFEEAAARIVACPAGKGKTNPMPALNYLMNFVLPNLHFHMSTTYAILRHNGVDLSKGLYLGPVSER